MSITNKLLFLLVGVLVACSENETDPATVQEKSIVQRINIEQIPLHAPKLDSLKSDISYGKEYVDFSYNFLQTSPIKRHLNTIGLAIDPSNTSYIERFSYSYKKSGEHEKAMRILLASVDASQTNEELLEHYSYMAWNYLYFYRDYHNTIKIVDEMMQLSNHDFGASCHGESCLILKGQALYKSGKLDEAIEVFEAYQAHEEKQGFNPMDDPLLVFYKGRCLAEKEEYEKAIPYFTYFTRHQPSAEAYFQLAHLFLQLNFKEDARLYINLAEEALQNGYTFREPYFERFDKVFMHQIEAFVAKMNE